MKDLLVMKFGGTSVGSAGRMRVAAGLAAEQKKQQPVAIPSDATEDVWWLRSNEILGLLRARSPANQMELIRERRAEHARWEQLTPHPCWGLRSRIFPLARRTKPRWTRSR